MKRKIEKYLAKKQAVDVANIRYTDDGRFDFMGDLDGVLSAVRGKEGPPRSRTKSEKKSIKPKKKREPLSSSGHQHNHMSSSRGMHHPTHHMYPYPNPYMHGMPAPPPMHHNSMSLHQSVKSSSKNGGYQKKSHASTSDTNDKENFPMTKPRPEVFTFSPQKDRATHNSLSSPCFGEMTPGSAMKTPFSLKKGDFPSKYFENTPCDGNPRGFHDEMTPLTGFREPFTPYTADGLFSLQMNGDLSKTLFQEDGLESILKTPKPKRHDSVRIRIGSAENISDTADDIDIQFRCQVGISPITDPLQRSLRYKDDVVQPMSVSLSDSAANKRKRYEDSRDDSGTPYVKGNLFMDTHKLSVNTPLRDTTMETVASDRSYHDISSPSPFDPATVMRTPGTANSERNSSFWKHQLGLSPTEPDFTPFRSPKSEASSYSTSKSHVNSSPKRLKLEQL